MSTNQKNYSFIQSYSSQGNGVKQLSMTGVLKPLSIGSINNICTQEIPLLKKKINYQLTRIKNLEMKLNQQVNNPLYIKVQQKNKLDLEFLKECEKVHRTYYNKVLYYRNRTLNPNVMFLNNLQVSYNNSLFQLNQNYQKAKLQLRGVDVSKGVDLNGNSIRNNYQLQEV